MANFYECKLMKANPRLKINVVPHKFECQKPEAPVSMERKYMIKRCRLELIEEAQAEIQPDRGGSECQPITSHNEAGTPIECDVDVRIKTIGLSPIKQDLKDMQTSPIKLNTKDIFSSSSSSEYSSPTHHLEDDYNPETDVSNEESDAGNELKTNIRNCTLLAIEKNPRLFLGLPDSSYFLIKALIDYIPSSSINILLTLKKIRLNDSFANVGIHFAKYMKQLIYWPEKSQVYYHLPIPFRARYKNVVSIIDCLEIEIEKPSNALHQALTWSQYKNCNTLKYLLSCTLDGLVNYISEGYGGRATDAAIVEDCGYLNKLQSGSDVMADRGFKNISQLLQEKGCQFIRPPFVSASEQSSKEDVKASKRIAALRIHVESVIGRLREFSMLQPHVRVDNHLLEHVDNIIKIACGVINMQDHLIKIQI